MTIAEMKAINKAKGYHFFDKDSMRFWGSKVYTAPNKYRLFIESHDNFDRTKKLYTVRFFNVCGSIEIIEPANIAETYEHFESLENAKDFLKKLTKALDNSRECWRENNVLSDIAEMREKGFRSGVYVISNTKGEAIEINTNNFDRFICG